MADKGSDTHSVTEDMADKRSEGFAFYAPQRDGASPVAMVVTRGDASTYTPAPPGCSKTGVSRPRNRAVTHTADRVHWVSRAAAPRLQPPTNDTLPVGSDNANLDSDLEFLPTLAPINIATMETVTKPSTPPPPPTSAQPNASPCQTEPEVDDDYPDDFDASGEESGDGYQDFDIDDDVYDELAFGIDIEPSELCSEVGDLSLTGNGLACGGLSIVGQQVAAPVAWGASPDPSRPPARKQTGVDGVVEDVGMVTGVVGGNDGRTTQYLIERKLGCSVYMIKDVTDECKNQL